MPRKKTRVDGPREVASWFFTYSDVITLLMTFFILLLTFSTTEPEKFEQMQYALFGGRGSLGIAGKARSSKPEDSFLMRQRPPAARMTTRGSQTPEIYSDPSKTSLSKGLEGMDEPVGRELEENHVFKMPISLITTRNSDITAYGRQQLRMFSKQLRRGPYDISFLVSREEDMPRALAIARYFIHKEGVVPGQVAVGIQTVPGDAGQLAVILTRHIGR